MNDPKISPSAQFQVVHVIKTEKRGVKRSNKEEESSFKKKKCALIAQKGLEVIATHQNDQILQNAVWISPATFSFFFKSIHSQTHCIRIINRVYRVFIARMDDRAIILPRQEYEALKTPRKVFASSFDPLKSEVYNISSIHLSSIYL